MTTEHVLAFGVLGIDEGTALRLGQELTTVASPHVDGGWADILHLLDLTLPG